jgi:hypothetical protein
MMTRIEKPFDQEYEEQVLTEVREHDDHWEICADGGWLTIDKVPGIAPKVGSVARYYGKGFGYPVRGVDIDGQEVYYRSLAEERERHDNWVAERKRDKQQKAEADKEETARRIAALPDAMQHRIQKFRDHNRDFDWEFLPYELFCCEEAVKIAVAMRKQVDAAAPADQFRVALDAFRHLPYEDQKRIAGLEDGHSGNTFGMAMRLAYWLLTDPEMVVKEHGALVPLVGCEEYGCPHPTDSPTLLHEFEGSPT